MSKRKLSKAATEELVNTQVLNIEEVRKVASYEKSISKRPAVICALVGAILILIGGGTQGYITYKQNQAALSNKPEPIAERKVEEKEETLITKGNTDLTCTLTMSKNANGTSYTSTFDYIFSDDKLRFVKKVLELDALPNDQAGLISMTNLKKAYDSYAAVLNPRDGYIMQVTPRETGFTLLVEIDPYIIKTTSLEENYRANQFINLDGEYNSSTKSIKDKVEAQGYKCTLNVVQSVN